MGVYYQNADRRSEPRYPMSLKLQGYLYRGRQSEASACSGYTRNISRHGILIKVAPDDLAISGKVLLFLDWPVLQEGSRPLVMALVGRVLRNDELGTAVRVSSCRLCTLEDAHLIIEDEHTLADAPDPAAFHAAASTKSR